MMSGVRICTKRPAPRMVVVGMTVALCMAPAFGTTRARAQTAADNSAIYMDQGADRGERLIAKAREEGTLTLYTSMATTESGPLAQAFEKKYGVKVQLWRALSENVLQRALTEAHGGRRSMDVVETNAPEVEATAPISGSWATTRTRSSARNCPRRSRASPIRAGKGGSRSRRPTATGCTGS